VPIAIVTDSCSYLPADVIAGAGLHVVSLYIQAGGEATRETEITDLDGYFARLRAAKDLPTTSQPSIGDFLAVYEPLIATGHDIVSLHLSAGLSGTCNAAEQAREQLGDASGRVRVIDSRVGCGAQGVMALAASNLAAQGADAAAIAARVETLRDAIHFWFVLDTLDYLRRGGRIGGAQAWLGSALKIKPILSLAEQITPVERVRTTRRALERIVDRLEGERASGADAWAVQHIQAPEYADQLVSRGREIFGCEPVFCSEIGPVIGTHVGPGFFGAGAFPTQLLS
jgi:DegV family protein with EDD domain